MAPVITAHNLSKKFRVEARGSPAILGAYRTLREGLLETVATPLRWLGLRHQPPPPPEFWALEDVSFEVQRGEVLGIIGRNGAGKSTLLKILSRIMRPTAGEARIRGKIGCLLEVGTSFHPELTGRENIFLNGAVLGMTGAEIRSKFADIVAFAEVGRFLETPLKRYSSGMFIRLAFAVAAFLDPEILIIDEVLAVGDAAFQKKCLSRLEAGSLSGRTVVFVSHNMAALQRLCSRAIWLEQGRIVQDGPAGEVVAAYLRTSFTVATERVWQDAASAPGNEDVRMRRVAVRPVRGTPSDPISIRTPLVMEFEYSNLKPNASLSLWVNLCTQQGVVAFCTTTVKEPNWHRRPFPCGRFRSTCEIPGDLLNDGTHYVDVTFRQDEGLAVYSHEALITFEVLDDVARRGDCHETWPGAVRPELRWSTELLEPESGGGR